MVQNVLGKGNWLHAKALKGTLLTGAFNAVELVFFSLTESASPPTPPSASFNLSYSFAKLQKYVEVGLVYSACLHGAQSHTVFSWL